MNRAELLDQLLEGQTPADLQVPEDLAQLARLADSVADAFAAPLAEGLADPASHRAHREALRMRAEAKAALRNRLIGEANLRAQQPPGPLQRARVAARARLEQFAYSTRAAVAAGAAAALLSSGGVAAATTQALPGDLLYDLKLGLEDVVLSFAEIGVARGEGLLDQALNRITEAETATRRGSTRAAADALRLADEHTRAAAQQFLTAYLDEGETAILSELGEWVVTTGRRLDLLPPLTGEAADALADLRTTLDRIGQRIEVLRTGACTGCDLGVHDEADAPDGTARGTEADGTPPTPAPTGPVDLSFIPPASEPFRACPCVPAGPATSSSQPAPPPQVTPDGGDQGVEQQQPAPSAGDGDDPPEGDGEPPPDDPGPAPLPDTGPVTEPLPDPVRDTVEDILEQIPSDPPPTPMPEPPADPAQI